MNRTHFCGKRQQHLLASRFSIKRKEIIELRYKVVYADLLDDTDGQTEEMDENAHFTEIMYKLDNDLQQLYASMDDNNGVLADTYLIP